MVMLNPSTADEVQNDPTVQRCERRALRLGFGQREVVNLFALRSTDPSALYDSKVEPIGPANDAAIMASVAGAAMVLCGWGLHGELLGRGSAVIRLLRGAGVRLHALALTKQGHPAHPLYIGDDVMPFELTH